MLSRTGANETGKALLEMAVIMPFLVLLFLCGAETYKELQYHQFMSVISREVGNAAARSCSAMDAAAMYTCLETSVQNVVNNASPAGSPLRNAKVIVKIYRHPVSSAPISAPYEFNPASIPDASRFTPDVVESLRSFTAAKKFVVTTEVFLRQPSIAPGFGGQYYEATVF